MADDPNKGRIWGWIDQGVFRPLPRWPGTEHYEPPCDVTLPVGTVRRIVWQDSLVEPS